MSAVAIIRISGKQAISITNSIFSKDILNTKSHTIHFGTIIDNNIVPTNNAEIIIGYNIVGDFLDKTILKPNNISYPIARSEFINLIKWI